MNLPLSHSRLNTILDRIGNRRFAIVGDVILDHYVYGRAERLSAEAPIPILDADSESYHLGGAANVASNLFALGEGASLYSVVGRDDGGHRFLRILGDSGESAQFVVMDPERKTTVKQRWIADDRQIARADFETRELIGEALRARLLADLNANLAQIDAAILEDYDKGVLGPELIGEIVAAARAQSVITLVDPKFDNFFAYQGVTVFKPNLREASAALGRTVTAAPAEVETCCRELQEKLSCENVVLTLSKDGVAMLDSEGNFAMLPAMIRFVHDAAGAGDTVISVLAAAMAAGASLREAVTLANLAGGVICEKVGVQPVSVEEIRQALEHFAPGIQ